MSAVAEMDIITGPEHARFANSVPTDKQSELKAALMTAVENGNCGWSIRLFACDGSIWLAFKTSTTWSIVPNNPDLVF